MCIRDRIKTHLMTGREPFTKVGYLIEPYARNTAPAIGLAAAYFYSLDEEAVMVALPSDHLLGDPQEFLEIIKHAEKIARGGYLVTLGIKPTRPETGFGYIKLGAKLDKYSEGYASHVVDRFVEKPDRENAEKYLKSGDYFWNSGMFVFKASTILDEIKKYMPALHEILMEFSRLPLSEWNSEKAKGLFLRAEATSIDYGILERTDKVAVVPMDINWVDVGSLTAIGDFLEVDESGNAVTGNVVNIDSENTIVYGEKRLVATLGLKDMIVIDTHDATLVCPKDRAQDVRKVVDVLKSRDADEYLVHRTVYRPWGSYTLLESGPGFKIKVIEVKPGERLSLQMHHHRSEHWVVISGTARVTRGDEEFNVHVNESTFIPPSTAHRLENPGKIMLKIIEVQNGEYLDEDDIVRTEDDYARS
jgi:mannose-1-phosphate guanylyltransferase/mannose-6-phosphate isomerase